MHVEMVLYALMLMLIDVIEQVMSNAAIEQIDPLGRKSNSNNSLLVMWVGNMASSFFGGMTNLDGLAKSQTNRMAGALTKMSVLFILTNFSANANPDQMVGFCRSRPSAQSRIFQMGGVLMLFAAAADRGRSLGPSARCRRDARQEVLWETVRSEAVGGGAAGDVRH